MKLAIESEAIVQLGLVDRAKALLFGRVRVVLRTQVDTERESAETEAQGEVLTSFDAAWSAGEKTDLASTVEGRE